MAEGEFVRRLGEEEYWQDNRRVGILDLLADAGLLVHEGLVLTQRAHEEFLRTSGALRDIETAAWRGEDARRQAAEIRSRLTSYPIEGGLNQEICEALIGLNARTVIVFYADFVKGGLRSIPEVKDAVRDAWLSSWVGEAGRRRSPRQRSPYLAVAGLLTGQDLKVGARGRHRILGV